MNSHELKSMGQIFKRITDLVNGGADYATTYSTLRDELIAYYSTLDGRSEIEKSPHKHLRTSEAVDLLMLQFPDRINKEIQKRDRKPDGVK